MPATQTQMDAVLLRVAALSALVRTRPGFAGFRTPDVYFYDKRRAAGLAHPMQHRVGFHATLLAENFDSMLRETVAHEVAHIVVYWKWRVVASMGARRPQPHGCEWRAVMSGLFNVEPERTHSYDMGNVAVRRQRRWAYACGCRAHSVTTSRHNAIGGGRTFICRACRSPLKFTGEIA